MSGKLYIKTHGCQMNEYDSSRIADVLAASHQLEVTPDPAEADVVELEHTMDPVTEPTWIYLRGVDEFGGMAWSSPVFLVPE